MKREIAKWLVITSLMSIASTANAARPVVVSIYDIDPTLNFYYGGSEDVSAPQNDAVAASALDSQAIGGFYSSAISRGADPMSEIDLLSGTIDGPALDADSAVPEPATWAMMISGFGLVGGAMRRSAKPTRTYA